MSAASQHTTRNNKHRYRKIALKIWGDEKFSSLSSMPPSAQGLWLFLLAYPAQDAIPGVYRAGRASMAEQLDWSVDDFDRCFNEIAELGMAAADWSAKLVWLPNAARFNPPESPNVVIWWSKFWPEIPECTMKMQIYDALRTHVYATGDSYGKEFDKHFSKPDPAPDKPSNKALNKASHKPSAKPFDDKALDKASDKASDKPSDTASDKAFAADGERVSCEGQPAKPRHDWVGASEETANPRQHGDCKASDKASDKASPNQEQEHIQEQEHNSGEKGGVGEGSSAGTSPSAPSPQDGSSDLDLKKPVPPIAGQQGSLDGGDWLPPVAGGGDDEDDDVLEAVRESQTKTGTRLPPGYAVSAHWLAMAKKKRPDLPDEQIRNAAESFVGYWSAKPGREGLKLNWLSTWLNWVRKERAPSAGHGRSEQARLLPPTPTAGKDPDYERRLQEFRKRYPGARFASDRPANTDG